MTATNSEYWKNLHCDMKHLILHLGGLYCDRDILLEQFAMAIAYSNQSSIGVLSNAVLMMSCIYWVSDLDQHPLLVRPYNILLLQENVHSFQEKMVCTYVFRQIRTSFSGLETAYTKLKHSIEDSEKLTISLSTYRKALKRLQFYIALSRWYIINIYQNQNTSHILQIRNDTIIVVGEFKEIVEYMRSWEEAMKTWATELFINIYNIDYIVTQWHREYSHDMSKVIKFLLAEADSRLVSVVQPGASQVMQDGHESSVGRNINSDDESNITTKVAVDDDDSNSFAEDESNITTKVALDNDASNSFGEKRPRRQSSRLTRQAADAVKDGLGQQSNIQDEDEDEAHDSYGKTKKTRHSSRLQSNKPNEDLCGNIKKPGHSSSLKIKRKDDNETHCADIEAEKEKDAVEFDIMEDIKKIRSMGTCVVGFADLATQKLRCLTQELKKNFETLSRQNTLTNTTLTSHLGLIAGFDVRLEKYLKGKQWTTCNKDDSTAVLVDCQDSGKKHKIRLITLEEKVASKRKLGNVLVVNGPILDSKMVIELIDAINRSPMCKSTDVLGGSKKDTYLGYFSQRNPTQYGYRDGTIAIQAMPIKGAMTPLLDIVQNHVLKILYDHMGDQKKLIPTLLGTDIFKVKQNSLQINLSKGGGGFGEHTDSNSTTCMIGTEITNQTDEYFPYESEMVVITFFICLDKNQQLVNNNKCKSRLIFRSRKTKEVVGEIITESIGFHIQFANVQHACLHAIDKVGPQEEGFTRIALSSRYTLKQKYVGKKYNYYIRSLDHINGPLEDAILVDDPTVIPTNTMEVENLTTNTKDKDIEAAFASDSLKLDTVGMTQLIRNPVALGVPRNSSVNSLRSRLVFNTLMKAKKNLNVVQKKRGKETMIRYYTRLKPIGTIMEADKVRGMLELRKGGQSSVVGTYHNDLNHMHGIVLEHQYKNMMMNALPYFELVYKFRSNKTELYKKINKQKPEDMRYTVGPSGGNYANGNAFMTQTSKVDNTVCETAHTGQISQSMIAACLNRIVIGDVWVPLEWATSNGHKKSRGKKMINVGPARGYSCSGHSHCDDQPTHLVKHGVNGSWTTVGNMVYELEQVYHKDNLVPSFYSGYEVKGWSDFVFEGERIGVGVNRSDRLPSTPTDFADRHPAIVANKWITNELKERDKVSSSIHKNNSGKKDLVTIEELIAQIARISLASFARMKQYSVNPNGVSYLPLLEVGMVNGTYPIPNVSRCYHIPTMMIITELGVKDQSTGRYVRRSISSIKQPDEMLFIMMAIMVVRTTGGTLLFQLFHQYYKGEDIICDEFDLPSTSCKWDAFMRFMLEKIKRGAHGMERFVTVLYDRSLCDAAYGTVQEYVSFLEAVKRDLRSYLMECRNIGKQNGFNYTDLVLLLSNLLESNGYNQRKIGATEKKHCKFVGHQIACDMNELFHDAIHYDKKKNKIHFGSYGQKGLDMIVGSTTVKNASDKLVTLTKKILTALTQKKNQYLLDTLGLYLKNGIVVSKINDAPVWEADVESWLCKLVITSQKTGGAFCGSSKLCLNNRKYEFPLSNAPEQFEPFYHIAEEALYGLFSNRRDFGLLPVSSHFRYVSTEVWDEDENWKASCKVGLARQKTLLRYMKILNR